MAKCGCGKGTMDTTNASRVIERIFSTKTCTIAITKLDFAVQYVKVGYLEEAMFSITL